MSISLQKGQKIDLVKDGDALSKIVVGLGWDPVGPKKEKVTIPAKGLGKLFGKKSKVVERVVSAAPTRDIDCDASVFMLDASGKIARSRDVVYYGRLDSDCGSINHTGDNLTGEGEGDDESIKVNLKAVPSQYKKLVFVVNIYNASRKRQHFGLIENAFIRIVDQATGKELCRYNLSDDYSDYTGIIAASISRKGNAWAFSAIGSPRMADQVSDLSNKYK